LSKKPRIVEFQSLRGDWYYGVDYVVRLLRQAWAQDRGEVVFSGFPRQWIAMFEWLGLGWRESTAPPNYIPFISQLNENQVLAEVAAAQAQGQLRQLVETLADADIVLGDALQRLDAACLPESAWATPTSVKIPLTSWHSYSRPEIVAFEQALSGWRPHKSKVIFLPCGRARPYDKSATHHRLMRKLKTWNIEPADFDLIVMTSLGPVPEALWRHDLVLRYDTGVRDIYRMLVLLRRLLINKTQYTEALDCVGFRPYRDLLKIVSNEGLLGEVRRPGLIRSRTIPAYRFPVKGRSA
jgi:hypothetical protein